MDKFIIVSGKHPGDFAKAVSTQMRAGYSLHGNSFIVAAEMHQALVLNEPAKLTVIPAMQGEAMFDGVFIKTTHAEALSHLLTHPSVTESFHEVEVQSALHEVRNQLQDTYSLRKQGM